MPTDRGGRGTALAIAMQRAQAAEDMNQQLLRTIQQLTTQIVELASRPSAPLAPPSISPRTARMTEESDSELVDRKTMEAMARLAASRLEIQKKNERQFIENAKQTLVARGMPPEMAEAEARRIREESVGLVRDSDS
jgi:hypothetical protein